MLTWYLMLLVLGIVFFPITRILFKDFYDEGYALSKAVGIIVISYLSYALSTFKILPYSHLTLYGLVIIATIGGIYLFSRQKLPKKNTLIMICAIEITFFIALLFWAHVRSHEPSINGLEKFMDFGFIQSSLKTTWFPAKDMWLAGKSINYYYFGHVTGATLIKLSQVPPEIGYNLILATLFALGITQTFSIGFNLIYLGLKQNKRLALVGGILASFIVNFGGNLHTIYAFTTGYQAETPPPFWQLPAKFSWTGISSNISTLGDRLAEMYWYPNATRFIPFTIHEFPLYSYVVADLHGHVFDIPFVLLTLGLLIVLMLRKKINTYAFAGILGGLCAIHYMTNAFDALIYLALTGCVLLIRLNITKKLIISLVILVASFIIIGLPFNMHFEPFATGVGVNCAPQWLVQQGKIGPFIFETGKCQISQWWMLIILWGFFWFNFIFFGIKCIRNKKDILHSDVFVVLLFAFSTLLILTPEFVYAKDIYPDHFRANTMFKLGYQAFMMMGIASAYVFASMKLSINKKQFLEWFYFLVFIPLFMLIAIYPTFAIDSYYGYGSKPAEELTLDGHAWINEKYPEYMEAITFFNTKIEGQPTILEAQGDSYTEYDIVSAQTGIPTVAGWWVHEWLWRGDSSVVGNLIPDINSLYQSNDIVYTRELLKKYHIEYVVFGPNEEAKYNPINETKFEALGQSVFKSTNGKVRVYKILLDR